MRTFSCVNYYRKILRNAKLRQYYSTNEIKEKEAIENIRNIGILAHIDAGKTTTTERMLFYSGTIRSMGEVHHGNTVTDYMEQERQRGITITSAAVSFPWNDRQINLIDTPGHIDFTMEVEQSLAVLDGAVVVLDGSAGVEAQTLTVWHQADSYRVPRLLYLNKMDRMDADVTACVRSVCDKLAVAPVLMHIPVRHEGRLIGLIDIVNKEEIIWTQGRGQKYTRRKLTEKEDGHTWEQTVTSHRNLVDTLSSLDDSLAEAIIQRESLDDINSKEINEAIRRCTIALKTFPILCGSSYKNIGVQTLMDAVVDYLPSPLQCNEMYKSFENDLSARAFKVQHDDQRGVLTFLRLYSGEISKGQKIYNLGQDKTEQTGFLYVALADEYRPVEQVTAGNIAVVSGLKVTMPGELVSGSQAAASRAKVKLSAALRSSEARAALPPALLQRLPEDTEEIVDAVLGIGTAPPEPVFLCSVEPPSAALVPALETALAELAREDRSLRVSSHDDQIVLAGMGELHLEIIKERIIREYNIEVELGPLQIAYREALLGEARSEIQLDRKIGGNRHFVKLVMSARSKQGLTPEQILRMDRSPDSAANLAHVRPRHLAAIRQGVHTALMHGPKLACEMVDTQVTLHWLEVGRGTSDSVVCAAVVQCLRKVFASAGSSLLEPVMELWVRCPESHSSRVLADLGRRRAALRAVRLQHGDKVIECEAPLAELLGYSTALRSLSSGLATFTMQLHCHRQMAPADEEKTLQKLTGF